MTEQGIDADSALYVRYLVLALHEPFPVYDECINPECEKEHEKMDVGFVCTPPIGWACDHCCLDAFGALIDCRAHSGDHHGVTPEERCETVKIILGGAS